MVAIKKHIENTSQSVLITKVSVLSCKTKSAKSYTNAYVIFQIDFDESIENDRIVVKPNVDSNLDQSSQ